VNAIHQIYCTHCTHGSSALERREGELAHRMLGYSARAGSLELRELRQYYRQIERYAHYYLPRDTPGEEKLRLRAATAPRRLVYHPSAGGLQVIAQVCYRQTDTEGRPGSYFAHVLFRDESDAQPPWSQLDCLKLWGASGWAEEDSPHIPFLLQPLGSLDELLDGRRAAVDDQVFLSFLSTPAGGSFDDPAGVIPERWRQMDAARRCSLFTEAFRGFLEIAPARRESLLLVIEPSAAALVFYGVIRLLPAGVVRDPISFSTFEPNADRVATSLAATSFHDPQKTDLRPEAYRSRGFALNTYSNRRSENRGPEASYARTMVRRLLARGWETVDWSRGSFEAAGAGGPEDLNALAAVDNLVPALFDPRQPPPGDDWRRRPMAADYLRQAVGRRLSGLSDPSASLGAIVGKPSHLTILELLATEPEVPGTREGVQFLLEKLPGEQIGALLKLEGVSSEAKIDVLVRYVRSQGDLPPGCDVLWSEPPRATRPQTPAAEPLLWQVLARLDANVLVEFHKRASAKHSSAFLLGLLGACRLRPSTRPGLGQIVRRLDDAALVALFQSHGPAFFGEYPDDEPALGEKLHAMVESLVEHVAHFPERLDVVLAGRHLLPDADQDVVTAWANLRRTVQDVCRLQVERSGILRKRPLEELEAACRRMAREARRAMPRDRFDDDATGSRKQSCLRQIGRRLSGGLPFLPEVMWQHEAIWQKTAWYFQDGQWSSTPLSKLCTRSWSLNGRWIIIGVLIAVSLVVLTLAALQWSVRGGGNVTPIAETSGTGQPTTTQTTAGAVAEQRPAPAATEGARAEETASEPSAPAGTVRDREAPPEIAPAEATPPAKPPSAGDDDPFAARHQATRPPEGEASMAASEGLADGAAQPPAPQSPPVEPPRPGPPQTQAESWKAWAERFAREHAGRLFDEAPLARGELAIAADALSASSEGGELFLGGGQLHFEHADYPFGAGFEKTSPVSRQEASTLARTLAVPSVYVEIQARPSGSAVVLKLVPNSVSAENEAKKEKLIDQVQSNARLLMVKLRAYNSRTGTKEQKDEAFDDMVKLAGVEIPPVPNKPNRRDEEYSDDPEAYSAALNAYNKAVALQNRARDSVIPTAKRAVATKDERRKYIETEFRRYEEQLQQHNEQASAELEKCLAISAIVYRAVERVEPRDASEPSEPADSRAAAKPTPSIDGRFTVEKKPAGGLDPPAIARLKLLVTASGGRPLPPWCREKSVTGCRVVEQDERGFLLRTITLSDIRTEEATEVFQKTTAIRVQFQFFRRSTSPFDGQEKKPLALAAHLIEAVEEGMHYTIKLELSKDGIDWLRLLVED